MSRFAAGLLLRVWLLCFTFDAGVFALVVRGPNASAAVQDHLRNAAKLVLSPRDGHNATLEGIASVPQSRRPRLPPQLSDAHPEVSALRQVSALLQTEQAGQVGRGASLLATDPWYEKDLKTIKIKDLEGILIVMCVSAIIGAIAFETVQSRFSDVDMHGEVDYGLEAQEHKFTSFGEGVWPLISPYFLQPGYCQWLYVAAVLFLALWALLMSFFFTLWSKEFWDIMEKKEIDKFVPIMQHLILMATTLILVYVYQNYVELMMEIHWRRWMTFWYLDKWLDHKCFYQVQLGRDVQLDNPDQRIQEDVALFIASFMLLASGFLKAFGTLCVNLPLLLYLSPAEAFGKYYCPGWLLYIAIIYSGTGTLAAHYIGGKLVLVNFARQQSEADFRYSIVQVRDHAESIALWGSEDCERSKMRGHFDGIVRFWWMLMMYQKRLSSFTVFYMQTSMTFPWLVLAPNYFAGQITLGTMFMLFRSLGSVKEATDWCLLSYGELTKFRATADRLLNFQKLVQDHKNASEIVRVIREQQLIKSDSKEAELDPDCNEDFSEINVLSANAIQIWLPPSPEKQEIVGRQLWEKAALDVRQGEFVLLTAPSGTGKSCFFKALGGIWPYAAGETEMPANTLFVPQKPYIPQGTLKQALTYPAVADSFTDEQVAHALEAVGLKDLLNRHSLAARANWELVLSGGEAQRVSIAHAVLHRPQLLFLDEATSNMNEEAAVEVYRLLRKPGVLPTGAAVVSISHEVALLAPLHDSCFRYDAEHRSWMSFKGASK